MQSNLDTPPTKPNKFVPTKSLDVILSQTENHRPYITVQNFPGLHADMTIEQIRKMGQALIAAADECAKKAAKESHFPPVKRSYEY